MSEQEQRHRVHELFTQAVELTGAERTVFLQSAVQSSVHGGQNLLAAVNNLLDAYDRAGRFLADPQMQTDPLLIDESRRRIGPYRLERVIGEGGNGTVYLAEQDKPLRRNVALKVIRAGRDTRQTIARFDLERQALARMDHPNIARAFDAGTTPDGRPYFVMEWVDGKPVTEFCRSKNLGLDPRLAIFREICAAVQHAHQKGIIHRDLKPTNVLVLEQEGRLIVKVIDFGIAKAINDDASGVEPGVTQERQLLGTPQYMSPEQLGDDPRDIDTRADVYALGALLYELLTDQPPFEASTLRSVAFAEVRRILCEEQPAAPSDRAPARRTPRELDWVVLKAIEKDRSRRYSTVEALSSDIQRYMSDQPVEAGPPSRIHAASLFIRRHRRLMITGAVVALALIGGTTGATVGMVRAHRERDRAVLAEKEEAEQRNIAQTSADRAIEAEKQEARQRKLAEENARRAFSAQQFVYELVLPPAPATSPASILKYLSSRADDGLLADHREVLATLHLALGMAYQRNDQADPAIEHYRKYLALQPNPLPDSVNNASALHNLGAAILSKDDYKNARPLFAQSLQMYHRLWNGEEKPDIAAVIEHLGVTTANQGDLTTAEPLLRKSIALYELAGAPQRANLLGAMQELAQVLDLEGNHVEAKVLWDKTASARRPQAASTTKPQ